MKQLMLFHALKFVNRVIFRVGRKNLRSQRAVKKIGLYVSEHGQTRAAAMAFRMKITARDLVAS